MNQFNYKCIVVKNGTKMYYNKVKGKWKRISNKVGKNAEKGKRKYKTLKIQEQLLLKKPTEEIIQTFLQKTDNIQKLSKPWELYVQLDDLWEENDDIYFMAYRFGRPKNFVYGLYIPPDNKLIIKDDISGHCFTRSTKDLNRIIKDREINSFEWVGPLQLDQITPNIGSFLEGENKKNYEIAIGKKGINTIETIDFGEGSGIFGIKIDESHKTWRKEKSFAKNVEKLAQKLLNYVEYSTLSLELSPNNCPKQENCEDRNKNDINCSVYFQGDISNKFYHIEDENDDDRDWDEDEEDFT